MVLIWIEAWAGSMGLWPRRRSDFGESQRSHARQEPSWRAPVRSTPMRRRCWVRVDPRDRGHAAIGGSFAEVCAALERLAAIEESRSR